ncbi:MAG: DUF4830 domain-containing protein [Ruminiclostridium sp.]|nr:DUF4830 domain-containing protein [Ruminiclostridium sp.]
MKRFTAFTAAAAIVLAVVISFSSCASAHPAKSESDITGFLSEYGVAVTGDCTRKTVTIPEEFGEVYEKYNDLQKQQGFDLYRYRSREAEVYTFDVVSVGGKHKSGAQAHVMVCDSVIIGCDIADTALSGELVPIINR